jgi:hypothetical protein
MTDNTPINSTPLEPEVEQFEGGLVPVVSPAEAAAVETEKILKTKDVEKQVETVRQLAGRLGIDNPDALSQMVSAATGALKAEVEALRSELQTVQAGQTAGADGMISEDASPGGYPWQLWRFGPSFPDEGRRGWLAVLPGGATPKGARDAGSYGKYLRKGLIPIGEYRSTPKGTPGSMPVPTTARAADVFLDVFRRYPKFAGEFPASQVIAYRWHIAPPIRGLKFPQYENAADSVANYVCEACGESYYFMKTDRTAGTTYRLHLMGSHKYPFSDAAQAIRTAQDIDGDPVRLFVAAYRGGDTVDDMIAKTSPHAEAAAVPA